MKRKLINKLLEWKEISKPNPILLTGARSVGKTYLVYDFARAFYKEYIYINFETEPFLYDLLFQQNSSMIESTIKDYYHLSDSNEPVLLILDEISDNQDIDYILEGLNTTNTVFHIIFITSFLNVKVPKNRTFYYLTLYPLDFEEFLIATGNEWYIEVITTHFNSNVKIPDIVHKELLSIFETYLSIGGMPLAVNEYINTESLLNISEQHRILIHSYIAEVYNRNSEGDFLKIYQAFHTIGTQLMKENRKFQYKLIRRGATQAQYWEALKYISNSGYGMFCTKLPEEGKETFDWTVFFNEVLVNEKLNENSHLSFKLYMGDTGILSSVLKEKYGHEISKKGILENYVAQSLYANGYPLVFWESNSLAKLDFIIRKEGNLLPIEVKVGDNTRSRNVSIFKNHYPDIKESIKISARNFEYSNHVKYVPYYAVFCL